MFIPTSTAFRPARELEATTFRPDGSRVVRGPLGIIEYDTDGNARFVTEHLPTRDDTHTRWDLAA